MSNRPCNYCDYQRRKREAEKKKQKIETKMREGWVGVYINGKYADCSYMTLPSSCEC